MSAEARGLGSDAEEPRLEARGSVSAEGTVLELDGVGKAFGRTVVLQAASFTAHPGRITALMGRNGAGKSTLLRIGAGCLAADFGRILFHGAYLERPSLARMARNGLMFSAQRSTLTSVASVREQFGAFVLTFGGEDRFDRVVEELRLGTLLDRSRGSLSGGERQRAALGLAMVRAPDCLLMDEPFAGVAPLDRPLVTRGLQLLRARGTAIVISGHDVADVLAVADEVIWVTSGTTHWLGAPTAALDHHQFRREYLGPRADLLPRKGGAGEP